MPRRKKSPSAKNGAQGKNKAEKIKLTSRPPMKQETKKGVGVVFLFALAMIFILSLFDLTGAAGAYIVRILQMVFGWGKWIFPLILIVVGYLLIDGERLNVRAANYLGIFLLVLSYSGLMNLAVWEETASVVIFDSGGRGGGALGIGADYFLQPLGFWGALVFLIALFLISLLITFETTIKSLIRPLSWLKNLTRRSKHQPDFDYAEGKNSFQEKELPREEGKEGERQFRLMKKKEKEKGSPPSGEVGKAVPEHAAEGVGAPASNYQSLPLSLLEGVHSKPAGGDIRGNRMIIQKALENFGIAVEMGEVSVGPTVTQYTFKPAEGIKLARVTALSNDLSMALAAHPIRIEAPIPGKSLVGIEIPNQTVSIVSLREVLDNAEFRNRNSNLSIALGKDVAGQAWVADLSKMPHLLVAGATGSGKTICLNSIIISLLYQNSPAELKMILVDPKRVELTPYNNIPHLITPVVTDTKKTVNALRWAVAEMDRRFETLSRAGNRDIQDYNKAKRMEGSGIMPYLVIVIDELADLMVSAGAEVEAVIVRLAQMARAVGIHLVMATQRPSVDVITGLIKANITSRIAFSVASSTDSRTILDFSGAEKLLGRGDMLFIAPWVSKPKRIQGVYISTKEIGGVANFLKRESEPEYIDDVTQFKSSASAAEFGGDSGEDELLPDAKEVILQAGRASASLLQRRLKVGYARAARLLDLLEEEGFIGPVNGAKPREILRQPDDYAAEGTNGGGDEDREDFKEE